MYGLRRLCVSPAPSNDARCVSNGLETATSTKAKKVAMPPKIGTTHAVRSRSNLRFAAIDSVP